MFESEVEVKNAKYVIFVDYGADPMITGYETYKEAKAEIEELRATIDVSDTQFQWHIARIEQRIPYNRKEGK